VSTRVTIDTITYDPTRDEFVLYLVEDGPWPNDDSDWDQCLARIQNRIFDAFDTAVDGHLQKKYSDSLGKSIRIQIDSPHGTPKQLSNLITKIKQYIDTNDEYSKAIKSSPYIQGLWITTGAEMGRFAAAQGQV